MEQFLQQTTAHLRLFVTLTFNIPLIQEDIYEILTNRHAYEMNSYQMEDSIESELHSEGDCRLPPIGTRVRKGPNWPFLYTGQDSNLCGTVIGHRDGRKYYVLS